MRITFLLPFAGTAGGTRVVAAYADRLARRGHDVLVVSTPKRDRPLRVKIRMLLKGQGWPKLLGPSHLDHVDVKHRIIDRFRPITDADLPDADVVIATWWETAEWLAKLSPSKGAKVHLIQHDETVLSDQKERVLKTWSLPTHKITIAKWLVDLGRDRAPNEQIDLVPNAVDLNQFRAPPRGKQNVPTVGVMYSQAHFKGCDVSLAAMRMAREKIPNLKLVAFGTQDSNETLPLPDGIHYAKYPAQDQIAGIYASCDVWLFASRTEGFGLPVLESMACRTPVIATPAGAAARLVGEGGGILVNHEDPQAMRDAILRICAMDGDSWRQMSDRAHQTATAYTWDDATARFEASLKRAAKQRAADRRISDEQSDEDFDPEYSPSF